MMDSYGLAASHAAGHTAPGRRPEIDENSVERNAMQAIPSQPETTPRGWASWPADTPKATDPRAQRC